LFNASTTGAAAGSSADWMHAMKTAYKSLRAAPGSGKAAGFHLSSLYSPVGWFSWANAAKMFTDAQKNPALLQVFVNTVLGETWALQGDAPEW
jgi:Phage terminase large subunit (GpA)